MSKKPLGLLLAVLLLWLVAYPIGLVLLESVGGPGEWTLDYIKAFVRDSFEWSALWGSVWISVASVALAEAIGIPAVSYTHLLSHDTDSYLVCRFLF